jgi:UDPglucose 6-dehydrogenase
MNDTTITVLGAGYVGLSTAAIFANAGKQVFLVEPNKARLDTIKSGKSWFYEAGLDNLISTALEQGTLILTEDYAESVANSSIVFSCVGTPDNVGGSSNLTYVFKAAEEALKHLKNGSIFVQKSTVPVGTGAKIKQSFLEKNISYVSNPEFLREGTALNDTLFFDRVVIGGDNPTALDRVKNIYQSLDKYKLAIINLSQVESPKNTQDIGQYITTDLNSAELIKVTSNAFLALKISFANSIAILADKSGGNITDIMTAVGADKRIGKQFLHAGRGYGGGCFPKDVAGLISSSKEYGVDLSIMRSAQEVNEGMAGYIVDKFKESMHGDSSEQVITVLGTAFKSGTSDIRRSPGIKIVSLLLDLGYKVKIYDPQAFQETLDYYKEKEISPSIYTSLREAVIDADAVIIATEWKEFSEYNLSTYKILMSGNTIVDAVNILDPQKVTSSGLRYIGVGRR